MLNVFDKMQFSRVQHLPDFSHMSTQASHKWKPKMGSSDQYKVISKPKYYNWWMQISHSTDNKKM